MNISNKGINLLKMFEGLLLEVYKDEAGLSTIGYGHLILKDESFDSITEEEAEDLLREDIKIAEECINSLVKIDMTQNQFDALVCFVFNIGCFKFKTSTLLNKLNEGNIGKASSEFLRWNKIYDKNISTYRESKGLTKRRTAEFNLFLSDG